MEREQKFVVWMVVGLLLLALVGMSGCDYWPPALQAQIEELRADLNNALDDNQRLDQELTELKARHRPLQQAKENSFDFDEPLGHPAAQTSPAPQALTEPRYALASKGSQEPLKLERPHRRGDRVAQLQRLLQRHRLPIRVDGEFGPDTDAAVRWFQRVHGLRTDGIVGPVTYRALRRTEPAPRLVRQIGLQRPPLAGVDVSHVQRALRRAGHRLPVDGHFGHDTQAAVKRFQRQHGLRPDGVVGPQTWRALKTAR